MCLKDTVVAEGDLVVVVVVQLDAVEADVVGVSPRGQQLQLEDD